MKTECAPEGRRHVSPGVRVAEAEGEAGMVVDHRVDVVVAHASALVGQRVVLAPAFLVRYPPPSGTRPSFFRSTCTSSPSRSFS